MKKAQIHMMETVMVVLVFLMLLTVGIIFFISQQKAGALEKQREYDNLNIIKKSQVLNFLPELQCSFDGVVNSNCYDSIKVGQFASLYADNQFYYHLLLGNIRIEIAEYDPSPEINSEVTSWMLYDHPKPEDLGYRQIQYPVSIYNTVDNNHKFGILKINVYT